LYPKHLDIQDVFAFPGSAEQICIQKNFSGVFLSRILEIYTTNPRELAMKYFMILCLTFFTSAAFASGGGGGGSSYNAPARVIDQNYEAGKNIYNGRSDAYGKLKFCVVDATTSEKVAIKRATVKPYKGKTVLGFAENLYDCNNPEEQMIQQLDPNDMNLVLYYLNKRYKLKLEN